MMDEMVAKGKKEKHEEEVEFSKFHQWCDSLTAEKKKSIATATAEIEELAAAIDKAESDAEVLTEEIAELEAAAAKLESEADAATAVRNKEHEDYSATHLDLSDSIDAISRAIQTLKQKEADVPQSASLLQLQNSPRIPAQTKAVIASFLALQSGSNSDMEAPEANAYEFQSGGVVSLLEKLKLKFEDEKLALEKEEMSAKANYEVLNQQLTDDIKFNKATIKEKTAMKAKRLEDAATAKGDKEMTEASKAKDEGMLSDTLAECKQTSDEFEKNQVVRAGEIKALEEATKIMSSGDVTGMGEKHLPQFLQTKKTALAQLRSVVAKENGLRERVVEMLQTRAKKLGSKYLALMATRASEDPFAKVKKMIKDLIVKLMEEANAEADQHAYCETELATNKQTREIKSSEVEQLTAEIEEQEALFTKLTTEITELSDEVAAIKGEQKKATDIRTAEKETNTATIADAKVAQAAVEKATTVLKEFYSSVAAGSAALMQDGTGLKQEMSQAASLDPYKGQQSGSGGIMGMLEVILSDFARLETETSQAEDSAASLYEKFMNESNEDVAVKETEIEHKSDKKDTCAEDIRELKKTLELTQTELDKALEYYEKLKAECVDTQLSYEERVKMREEEIQSLQEALKVLAGEDLGF